VFGLPGALGLPGLAGDPRLWFLLATAAAFIIGFRLLAGGGRAVAGQVDGPAGISASWAATLTCAALALGSPVLAPQVIAGGTDVPVLALLVLALACAARPGRVLTAGLIVGAACALKTTAWPAVPVLAAMLAARDGARSGARFAAAAAAAAIAGIVAAAPAALAHPATVIQNTVAFPLGLARLQTPAASPLPGHLLASAGPVAHRLVILILMLAGAAVAGSLIIRPPASVPAAARRLAFGLALMIVLAPATRWGYCVYPLGLAGWLILARPPAVPLITPPAACPNLTRAAAGSDDAGVRHLAGLGPARISLTQAGARHDHSGRNRYRAGSRHRGQAGLRDGGAGAAAP
jgi:Glycosyltransferase family 87